MARMSSVIYAMHNRVSATDEQASAHLDAQSLNSMQNALRSLVAEIVERGRKTNRFERERIKARAETIKRDFHDRSTITLARAWRRLASNETFDTI